MTQGLSALGNAISYFTIVFWLTQTAPKKDLIFLLTVLSLITLIPRFVISPIAGVWVDRFDRKKIMLVADLLQGFLMIVLLFAFYEDLNVWILFSLLGVMALINQVTES
ncbi:MFS transporter [Thermoflavimicrobium daqui]|uniref:MFS transporter n=1 Tax=Thermoflavimicrobium daqui TaxID=2137476 RepID=A0A364K2G0_9BACL|nr:hypothetical protein DL897_14240 [Thermoflavimicrobium daqui]